MTDKEKNELVEFYCGNEMKELKKICDPIIARKSVAQMYHDELYSDGMKVLMESLAAYDETKKCSFHTFLVGNIKRSFFDWTRDNMRFCRCNLETDENGRIKRDENGDPIAISNISLDSASEDDKDLLETIASDSKMDIGHEENVQNYLEVLDGTEKKVAELIMNGYSPGEIKNDLRLTDKKYDKIIDNMKDFNRSRLLKHRDEWNKNVEEKEMVNRCVQTTFEKSKHDRMSVSSIIKKIDNYTIRFDHPLQRESDQWSSQAKGNLISDILQDNPIPALVFAEQVIDGLAVIWDLDGKQRCTTVRSFFYDGFRISKKIKRWNISYQAMLKGEDGKPVLNEDGFPQFEWRVLDIRGKKMSDLPEELKDRFQDYNFEIVQYINCSDEDLAYHIARYNEGRPMNAQQKGIINLGNKLAPMVKDISAMPFFKVKGNYSPTQRKNGTVDRVVVESVMTSNFLDEWNKDYLEMCKFLESNAKEETFENFEDLVDRLSEVADDEILEMMNIKDTFLWFGLFGRFVKNGEDDKKFIEFMAEFSRSLHSKKVDGVSYDDLCYDESGKRRATKDKNIVVSKIEKLTYLMNEFLHIDTESNNNKEETENNVDVNDTVAVQEHEESLIEFVRNHVDSEATEDDCELYKSIVDDCVKVDAPIYAKCGTALIAMAAYACNVDKDQEFERWVYDYGESVKDYKRSQLENYESMKGSFNLYCNKNAA